LTKILKTKTERINYALGFASGLASESLIPSLSVTISTIERSVSRRFEWKLSYFGSTFRTFPIPLIHLSREISIGFKFFEGHEISTLMIKEKKRPLELLSRSLNSEGIKVLPNVNEAGSYFGPSSITKTYFKITRLTSLLALYSLFQVCQVLVSNLSKGWDICPKCQVVAKNSLV